jgi:hypothetical protein
VGINEIHSRQKDRIPLVCVGGLPPVISVKPARGCRNVLISPSWIRCVRDRNQEEASGYLVVNICNKILAINKDQVMRLLELEDSPASRYLVDHHQLRATKILVTPNKIAMSSDLTNQDDFPQEFERSP